MPAGSDSDRNLALALLFVFLVASSALSLALLRRPAHDTLVGLLPMRIWQSDLLHAHDWPAWSPYTRYGLPLTTLHFVSNFTNPVGVVLGALFHYNVWTLAVENTIWRMIGLAGAYLFARRHVRSPLGAAVVACCYVGSGSVALTVLNGTVFAGLTLTPWLLVGLDHATIARRWQEWCRATGILTVAATTLVGSGYPGTWLTAPFLLTPYAIWMSGRSLDAVLRLVSAAIVGAGLTVGMLSLFVLEGLSFPQLFGGMSRNLVSASHGVFLYQSLVGLWLPNPTYVLGLNTAILQPIYVGLLPALLLCAKCAPWKHPAVHWLRPIVLTLGALLIVGAPVYARSTSPYSLVTIDAKDFPNPAAALTASFLHPAYGVALGMALMAIGAFPARIGRWERLDVALLVTTVTTVLVASPNPMGNLLRFHVVPFSLVRWNYLYLWVIALTVPLLAWRTAEQVLSHADDHLPPRWQRINAWARASIPALGLLAAVSLLVAAAPPSTSAFAASPEDHVPDRIGTVVLTWDVALVLLATAGAAGYFGLLRRPGEPIRWLFAGGCLVLGGALSAGWLLYGNEGIVRAFTLLPPGGRHMLDIAQQGIVLLAIWLVALRANTWTGILRGAALIAVLDVCLAVPRYLSDSELTVSSQGPAHVTFSRSLDFASVGRAPDASDSARPDLVFLRKPTIWIWEGTVPHVAQFDQRVGEPSIFLTFGHFPIAWRDGSRRGEVEVDSEQFRARATSVVHTGDAPAGNVRTPVCPPEASTATVTPSATVTRLLSSVVDVDLVADCDRLMVYTDTWAPGWQVWVDGRRAQALRVNGAIRGVMVPAGRHTVEWRYRPRHLALLLSIMGISFLVSVALVAVPWLTGQHRIRLPHPRGAMRYRSA